MIRDVEMLVGMFPGQGSYRRGALLDAWRDGDVVVREVYAAVDDAAETLLGKNLTSVVFSADPPTAEGLFRQDPDLAQLAAYAQSVAMFQRLHADGVRLTGLFGHSLGEIAALVCSGAYSIADGAALLCERIRVLRELDSSGGVMLALGASSERVQEMLALVGDAASVIAVRNSPQQTVVSGPAEPLRAVAAVAAAIGVNATPLRSPHAFHNPLLQVARDELRRRFTAFAQLPLRTPVYSPISGRFYRDTDDLAELLAQHLVVPVDFGTAIDRLCRAGASAFVEFGPGGTLAGIVRANAPMATVVEPFHDTAAAVNFLTAHTAKADVAGTTPSTVDTPAMAPPVVPPQVRNVQAEVVPSVTAAPSAARDEVFQRVRGLYAETLGYPEEVLTPEAAFEAELGIDSVQQTELLQQVTKLFYLTSGNVSAPTTLSNLDSIVDYIIDNRATVGTTT
ncbi:malonyl CoA-acyl carrier protein transacylase [Lentzea atacamensis]|uniref:[acyl-carrier-protein] S-malonyltransferase n=1 Tax=Lentzea atacamensis TaxID=531938 RepID=A0A316HDF3_9PSEU|nr:acyltransferase domain-containing protein [Lentzea atacamensis]PWK78556.1 malonyl CoA-acyl carrier protein transacylase [Lentzea atacamensis]